MAAEDATATPFASMHFHIHSTFCDNWGLQISPSGLEWDLPGHSIASYAVSDRRIAYDVVSIVVRRGILHEQNRWLFAKDRPF